MKTGFAIIGASVVALAVAGMLGIGHFGIYYGPKPLTICGRQA